jgi:hypothetical protein
MRRFRSARAVGPLALLAAVAGILVVATALSQRLFEGPAKAPPARPPAAARVIAEAQKAATLFRVAEIEGPVETFQNDRWYVVQAGDFLSLRDVIRTQKGARVVVRRGSTEIEVQENVDVRLDSLAGQAASFGVLRGGNLVANVGAEGETVAITANETRSVNEGRARWVVAMGPNGRVSVAAATGAVRFAARGREVQVGAGMESTAPPGGQPADPEPIPDELLLSVVWPELDGATPVTQVSGKVRPSSRVKVNGIDAETGPDGRFTADVPLAVGKNRITVDAEGITGQKKNATREVTRTARPPTLKASDEPLWKQ